MTAISPLTKVPAAHNVLKADGPGLVVAADFSPAGRPTATFTEFAPRLTTPCTFWETAPPPYGDEVHMTGAEHVARWASDIRASGLQVMGLIGFCTGSLYAGALAERVAQWQPLPPRLVLLDPEFAPREPLLEHYQRVITNRLASVLTAEESAEALSLGAAAYERSRTAMGLTTEITELCRRLVQPALERAGFTARRAAEFVDLFTSYLHWFSAAAQLDSAHTWAEATAVNSETPGFGLSTFTDEQGTGLVARSVDVAVAHRELLRSADVAHLVDGLLR